MRFLSIIFFAAFAANCLHACGNKESEKADSKDESVKSVRVISKNRPITRTANTDLAAGEGCYRQEREADELCEIALKIFELTNVKREGEGKAPLKHHAGWHLAARNWSEGQAAKTKISHDGFPDQRIETYEKEFGNDGEPDIGAENVGVAKLPASTPEKVAVALVDGWFKSPGHYKNMMGAYDFVGVGVFKAEDGKYYATQLFARPPL